MAGENVHIEGLDRPNRRTELLRAKAANALTARVATNETDIAQNTSDIAQNTSDIATNASDITTLEGRVDDLEAVLVQSGIETQTADANGAFTAITFPTAFSGTPAVTLTVVNTSISQQDTCNIFSVSSTQVRWRVMRNNGNIGATSATVHWVAVGPA